MERGGHEELLGRRGVYWEMVRGQMLDRAVWRVMGIGMGVGWSGGKWGV